MASRSAPAATSSASEPKTPAEFASGSTKRCRCTHAPQKPPLRARARRDHAARPVPPYPNATPGPKSPARRRGKEKATTPT
uniref:Uncharacterized protein n=1 Tax=Arundo donax TaxID=35708 RepID=A0A0A8XUJ8_ARUDO